MRLREYVALFLSVLRDWRVIATTLLVLLSWVLLRYVGLIYTRRRLRTPRKPRKVGEGSVEKKEVPPQSTDE